MKKAIALLLVLAVFLAGCATMVRVETTPEDARVRINGITGKTMSLSDAFWSEYDVVIEKEGYRTFRGRLEKEFKVGAFIGGLFFFFPWLYVYGPKPYQFFELERQ